MESTQIKFSTVVLIAALLVSSYGQELTYEPANIIQGLTKNVTMTCEVGSTITNITSVIYVKIKQVYHPFRSKLIVEVKKSGVVYSPKDTIVTYNLADVPHSYVQVMWPKTAQSTFGKFVCETVYFDTSDNVFNMVSREIRIMPQTLTEDKLFELVLKQKNQLDRFEENTNALMETNEKTINNLSTNLTLATNQEKQLNGRLLKLEQIFQSLDQRLNSTIDDYLKILDEIEPFFGEMWPEGTYSLESPSSGCPLSDEFTWETGYIQVHTESSDPRNRDEVSANNHLSTTMTRVGVDNYVTMRFCTNNKERSSRMWPKGSYCIGKKGACPRGFNSAKVVFDIEDNTSNITNGKAYGNPMDNSIDNLRANITFCCRADAVSNELFLPTSKPFYLYKNKNNPCHKVKNMKGSEEFIIFDTESYSNYDSADTNSPVTSINPVKLGLCYYSP